MDLNALKRLASHLPGVWQQELRRILYRRQIRSGTFETTEPEFQILDQLVSVGDWVIDVGANVGHYTKRLSDLVGPRGRVIAVEPVPDTFALLAANVSLFRYPNVTLLNLAASDQTTVVGVQIPDLATGLKNYYQATVTTQESDLQVLAVALDSLMLVHRVALIKVDAEGMDPIVLRGAERLLARDYPTLIVETTTPEAVEALVRLGYTSQQSPGSPNRLFRRPAAGT